MAIANIIRRFTKGNSTPIEVRSGDSGQFAGIAVGRTANEVFLFVVGSADTGVVGSAPGDAIIRLDDSAKKIHIGIGTTGSAELVLEELVVRLNAILVTLASSSARAGLRISSGSAPSSPVDGDLWYDGTNLKFRAGGTTRTITWT